MSYSYSTPRPKIPLLYLLSLSIIFSLSLVPPTAQKQIKLPPSADNHDHDEDFATRNLRGKVLLNPNCAQEISERCEGNRPPVTDLEALNCILFRNRVVKRLDPTCDHDLWLFRTSLMKQNGFMSAIRKPCHDEIESLECSKGTDKEHEDPESYVLCVLARKDLIKSLECREEVTLAESIMFSDYSIISKFTSTCSADIDKFTCGRNIIDSETSKFSQSSQGHTIECLSKNLGNLTDDCAMQVLRIAEFQADDYHLDRALYFACRDDRESFCKEVNAGNGKVYKCLLENKMDIRMSEDCRAQLLRRQKVGAQDYKATGIVFACKSEIKKYKCRKLTDTDKHVRLSQILLCLENAAHNGQDLNGECVEELRLHRKSLMEDHRATPELLTACNNDRQKFCFGGKSLNGKTIHCLMEHAMKPKKSERISDDCRGRLEELLKMTDVSSDWNVDPVLKETCQSVVIASSCRDVPANRILSCLMKLLTSDTISEVDDHAMTDACESTLLQIQYFMSRDFTMNNELFETCRADAERICNTPHTWDISSENGKQQMPNPGPLIISCLYRNLPGNPDADADKQSVSHDCGNLVREAMRERSLLVRLNPELESYCMEDLATLCSEKTKPGEEMVCLQDNFRKLDPDCQKQIQKVTEEEFRDPGIDPVLHKYCGDVIEKCEEEMGKKKQNKDQIRRNEISSNSDQDEKDADVYENLFQCLVREKSEMKNKKCKVSVERLQLLQLTEIRFTPKFKSLCQADVIRHCRDTTIPMTAGSLLSCLSDIIWNDTVSDQTHRISKACRKQMKYLTLSKVQLEDTMNDNTYSLCKATIKVLCPDVKPGGGRILECLRSKKEDINDKLCYKAMFQLEQDVNHDTKLDVYLAQECAFEIKTFCPTAVTESDHPEPSAGGLLTCLRVNSNKEGFDLKRCGKAVRIRLIEQNSDSRLNPRLHNACSRDIPIYCDKVKAGEGRILECLKEVFVQPRNKLTRNCKEFMEAFLKGAAQDVRIDYALYRMCRNEITTSCKTKDTERDDDGGDGGKIEECLMELFHKREIKNRDCQVQVQLLIQSTQIDIHVDPTLNRACAIDLLKFCHDIPPGEGRLVTCLLTELERQKSESSSSSVPKLKPQCAKQLAARSELFEIAGKPLRLESIQDVYSHVAESKERNYFLIVAMSIVGLIFIFGLFCGRATKRKAAAKNK